MTTTPTKNESLPELVARWRTSAAAFMDTKSQLGNVHAGAMYSCADELEAALTEAKRQGPSGAYHQGWRDCAMNNGFDAKQQGPGEAVEGFHAACDLFGIGSASRSASVLMANLNNVKRFADYLHAIESEFFMVPGTPDEDYPDDEPEPECLVNRWGSTREQYVEQFRAALAKLYTAPQVEAKRKTGEGE